MRLPVGSSGGPAHEVAGTASGRVAGARVVGPGVAATRADSACLHVSYPRRAAPFSRTGSRPSMVIFVAPVFMRRQSSLALTLAIASMGGLTACTRTARPRPEPPASSLPAPEAPAVLSKDDGFAIAERALAYPARHHAAMDCSHLVNRIYVRAGFPFAYATSTQIFEGAAGFVRVPRPQAGDLVAWRGHVGIVVDPARHSFYSALRSGLGVDNYESPYWRRRGDPRFYRYLIPSSAQLR